MPVRPTILATTTAKKLFNPIPGAMANGLFATNAITIIPIKDAIQVAKNTPFHKFCPSAPNPVRRFGFKAMMYAIVINVVKPAMISVFTVVWFSLILKIFSICSICTLHSYIHSINLYAVLHRNYDAAASLY